MSTIAILSTYAPSEGFGGPSRIFHQRRVLESAGHDVVHVVLHANASADATRPNDFVRLVERPFRSTVDHIYQDVDLGHRAARDPRLIQALIAHLSRRDTSLLILEQPFLVEIAAAVAGSLGVPVVYSCQNIEYRLRRDLERFQTDWTRPTTRSDEVRELEVAATQLASHTTAICASDQHALRDEFDCDSTLVPNGTSIADLAASTGPTGRSARPGEIPDFAFAGSSYWPNTEGFGRIATPSLAFLPPTSRIHVAGSICGQLLGTAAVARHISVNAARIVLRGFLPMDELAQMMKRSRAVLVPIFLGEGSNLKSADALACGAPVIMTERATYGYEDVLAEDPSGVTVVATSHDFRLAMLDAMRQPRPTQAVGSQRAVRLGWTERLQPLLEVVREVLGAASSAVGRSGSDR